MIIIYIIVLLIITVISSGWNRFMNPTKDTLTIKKQKCQFEGEDLFNKKVYDKEGKVVISQPSDLTCDRCSDYFYRESTDKCVGFTHDEGVCIPKLGLAKPCPSEFFLE